MITAILPVRNEDWVLGLSLRALLMWVDEAIVLNHASTDNTGEILETVNRESGGRVHVMHEANPVWREMDHRQRLLMAARKRGATHIVILDADEVLIGTVLPHIRGWVESLPKGTTLRGPMRHCHRGISHFRHDASIWCRGGYRVSIAFADAPQLGWAAVNGYDHHHREPMKSRMGGNIREDMESVMHLQFAHWRRLTAKHALYKMSERLKYPQKSVAEIDRMYSMALDETVLGTMPVPPSWWQPYRGIMHHLRIDQNEEQWQERECKRLMKQHGQKAFSGLNLFGVA